MNIKSKYFPKLYNLFAGLLDSLTGIVLIFNPVFILSIMGISESFDSIVFIKYVGVFVFSTGASYFFTFAEKYFKIPSLSLSILIWHITSLTRILVAIFVFLKVLQGELSIPWLLVGFSDLSLALFQVYLIQLNRDHPDARQ